jgi:hypothetical protein
MTFPDTLSSLSSCLVAAIGGEDHAPSENDPVISSRFQTDASPDAKA